MTQRELQLNEVEKKEDSSRAPLAISGIDTTISGRNPEATPCLWE